MPGIEAFIRKTASLPEPDRTKVGVFARPEKRPRLAPGEYTDRYGTVWPDVEPYYVRGELKPYTASSVTPDAGKNILNWKDAADERSREALRKDAEVLDAYTKQLTRKGLDTDTVNEIILNLAADQQKARKEFYAKPVTYRVTE